FGVRCVLQTEESDISVNDVAFQSTLCNLFRKISCHDHLILHLAGCQLAGSCISAVEAHESIFLCIVVFAFDLLVIHIIGYGVVDIQQSYGIVAYYSSDELAEGSVDINLAGYRDSLCGKTAVYIAGNEAELCLECRPTFACKGNELAVSSVLL